MYRFFKCAVSLRKLSLGILNDKYSKILTKPTSLTVTRNKACQEYRGTDVLLIHIPLFSDGDQEMKTEAHCLVTKVIR